MRHDLDVRPAVIRDSSEARAAQGGDKPPMGPHESRGDVSVKAGGVDYVDPNEVPRCTATTKHNLPCRAYATRTGLCVGHSRGATSDEV